jgi:exodeoxyribonuclease VII small subunit
MTPTESTPTFEAMLADLETIVSDLEDGSISLDVALARYEQGVGLIRCCYEKLKNVEQKIHQLTGVDEHGQPIIAVMDLTSETAPNRKSKKKVEE